MSGIKNSTISPLNNLNSQIKTSNIENPVESRLSSIIKNNSSRMNNFQILLELNHLNLIMTLFLI